jgi:hypothetical protein
MEQKKKQVNPYYPLLNAEQTAEACSKLVTFPEVIRSEIDPAIPGQAFCLTSLRIFPTPYSLKSGQKVYGLIKVRGTCSSKELAQSESARIIREVSSVDRINIMQTGTWVPIIDSSLFSQEVLDVKMSEEEMVLNDVSKQDMRKKEESIKKELSDRIDTLRNEKDIHDDPESLKYYCMKRVVERNILEEIDRYEKRVAKNRETHLKVLKELVAIQERHPEYMGDWVELYDKERASVGLPPYVITEKDKDRYCENLALAKEQAQAEKVAVEKSLAEGEK